VKTSNLIKRGSFHYPFACTTIVYTENVGQFLGHLSSFEQRSAIFPEMNSSYTFGLPRPLFSAAHYLHG
jgi:hypothetical protein